MLSPESSVSSGSSAVNLSFYLVLTLPSWGIASLFLPKKGITFSSSALAKNSTVPGCFSRNPVQRAGNSDDP
jgi:hypothetical protein